MTNHIVVQAHHRFRQHSETALDQIHIVLVRVSELKLLLLVQTSEITEKLLMNHS
jgi:hypothetical protein